MTSPGRVLSHGSPCSAGRPNCRLADRGSVFTIVDSRALRKGLDLFADGESLRGDRGTGTLLQGLNIFGEGDRARVGSGDFPAGTRMEAGLLDEQCLEQPLNPAREMKRLVKFNVQVFGPRCEVTLPKTGKSTRCDLIARGSFLQWPT
jgi:hypothetical protein